MSALKCLVLVCVCVAARAGAPPPLPPAGYHEAEGIPAMRRILQHERAHLESRISLGLQVPKGTHPYLGGVMVHLMDGRLSMCGASLLSNTKAVTAAHCWWDGRQQARHFTIVYGSDLFLSGGTHVITSTVEMHASFNPLTFANDIAIITHQRVEFNDFIDRILLPTGSNLYENTWAMAVGYGRTSNDPTVEHLMDKRQVMLQVISNLSCRNTWAAALVGNGVLCTGSTGGMSVCGGDSGGPLVVGSGTARNLIGITSFGADAACGLGFPAAFTRVTSYTTWINARM